MKINQQNKQLLDDLIKAIFTNEYDEPLSLTAGQLDIATSILDPDLKRVWMSTPTQYGKSMTVAVAACLLIRSKIRKEKILIVAPSSEQAQIIMDYVITFVLQIPELQTDLLDVKTIQRLKTQFAKDRLVWADGREIRIASANVASNIGDINKAGKNLMGKGATTVIVDETALIPDIIMSKVLRMLGKDMNAKLVLISNPFGAGYFYQASVSKRFHKIWIDYHQAIKEGRFTEEFIEEMRESMDADSFTILYEVKFIQSTQDSYIAEADYNFGLERLAENLKDEKWVNAMKEQPLKVGVDVARGGGDFTEFVVRKGYKIKHRERMNTRNIMEIANRLILLQKELEFSWEEVYIDVVNLGAGVVDRLTELGYEVNGVSGAESPDTKESYYNMRAELWGRMKEDIRQGGIDLREHPDLRGQLFSVKRFYRNKSGFVVILLESKEDLKKRGVKSPDIADALSLTYYEGVSFDVFSLDYRN